MCIRDSSTSYQDHRRPPTTTLHPTLPFRITSKPLSSNDNPASTPSPTTQLATDTSPYAPRSTPGALYATSSPLPPPHITHSGYNALHSST
eukprot:1852075-Alexandrium_andersonii.AAC.1